MAWAAPPLIRLEALRHGLGFAVGIDHDQWNDIAAEYAHAFYTTAPDVLRDQLSVDIEVLQRLLLSCPDDRDLLRAAAYLSMIMAITLTSAAEIRMARRWWYTARDFADRSGDLEARVMTRSQQAVKALYIGHPLPLVLVLADETIGLAGDHVSPGLAGVLAGRAQALALLDRPDEATQAMQLVEDMTGRMPGAARADESMFGWPEHRLQHSTSFVYTETGDTRRAMAAQDRALALYGTHQTTNRAMVSMHRATCLIKDGHIGQGVDHAASTLDAVPIEQHNQLIYAVARRAAAAVPHTERGRAGLSDLHHRLRELPAR
jgi:hypothetical protein